MLHWLVSLLLLLLALLSSSMVVEILLIFLALYPFAYGSDQEFDLCTVCALLHWDAMCQKIGPSLDLKDLGYFENLLRYETIADHQHSIHVFLTHLQYLQRIPIHFSQQLRE